MNEIYAFVGEIGAGKSHISSQKVAELKNDGKSVLLIAWADPIKQLLEKTLGVKKNDFTNAQTELFVASALNVKLLIHTLCKALSHLAKTEYRMSESDTYVLLRDICEENTELLASIVISIKNYSLVKTNETYRKNYIQAYRNLIQFVGTELGRSINDQIWIEITLKKIRSAFQGDIAQAAIVDDVRFKNEFDALANIRDVDVRFYGVTAPLEVRLARTGYTKEKLEEFSKHPSESEIPNLLKRITPNNLIENA